MRRIAYLIAILSVIVFRAQAQTVATFDDLYLSKADTFYVDYSASNTDVGFYDGLCYFPCVYDTTWTINASAADTVIDSFWSSGFAYSNMRDTVTPGYTNQYAAVTDSGYNSSIYAVATGQQNYMYLIGLASEKPLAGMYVTNATYAYRSMLNGDAFAKKFGNGDWFKLTIRGYKNGALKNDSVEFYLADFRSANPAQHYILNTWQYVDLSSLGGVDSVTFSLSSTDNGQFGMNTPAYFCIDNVTTSESSASVNQVHSFVAKVYPNPTTNDLYISVNDNSVQQLTVTDMAGRIMTTMQVNDPQIKINTSAYAPGMYLLQLQGAGKSATVRFVKQ